jgi:hypothetical protein
MHRMAKKRMGQYRARFGQKNIEHSIEEGWRTFNPGEFHDEQPYLGCRRAHCGMCNGHKHIDPRRTREDRAWRAVLPAAYGDGSGEGSDHDWRLLRADDAWEGLPRSMAQIDGDYAPWDWGW